MDSKKLKKIFSKDKYRLPLSWDGKDFYETLYEHLTMYREDIKGNYEDPDLYDEVKTVCNGLCAAVNLSFQGYPKKAYEHFENVMEILSKDPLLIDKKILEKEQFYRVVDVGNAAVPSRQRIFHVPFNKRSKMSTRRYSIPGFPSLYLGTTVELCCMELGKDPQRDYLCVSRYELQTDSRVFRYYGKRPVFDNDKFMIFDISIKPDEAIKANDLDIIKYIKWYPLISASSYIRALRDDPYSAEYIIPQLFTQWVRSKDEDAFVGIKYFSCAPVYVADHGYNYVFPTMGATYHARKTKSDYCNRLSHRFVLTAPRLIMEHKTIADCEAKIKEDNKLEYIEDYDVGEDKEIVGEYTIPNKVSTIGAFAFSGCSLLTSISIPDSVITISHSAFYFCKSLKKIIVDSSNEHYTSVDDILYNKTKTKLLCYPAGKDHTSFTIPSYVTSIGDSAFYGCSSLTEIEISDSVRSIGDWAFSGCSSLTNIEIPNSVTSIGDSAFSGCSRLTEIEISDNVRSIGDSAFSRCSSLTEIEIPNSVTSIGDSAFSFCSSLTNIEISNSVTSIGDEAFSFCGSLTNIEISNSVTSIGDSAFSDCSSLKKIIVDSSNEYYTSIDDILYNKTKTKLLCYPAGKDHTSFIIPPHVTSIGDRAFSGCSSLTNIEIPNSVTSIGDRAFSGCSSLTDIKIPDSVTSIGDEAFSFCSSLTNIEISNSVTSVGDWAFSFCSSLTNIEISNSVTSIGDEAFFNCSSLKKIIVDSSNEYYTSIDDILYNKTKTKLLCYPAGKDHTSFIIPPHVTRIGDWAFYGCSSLTKIEIPNSVTSIGDEAFSGCSSLTNIEIPNSVTSIGDRAFSGCSSLTDIKIPNSVTSIGDEAFFNCSSLTNIEISNSVTSVGDWAYSGCSTLTEIEIPNSVTSIGDWAFSGCSSLTNIEIPNSVTSIGDEAFSGCSSLKKIIVDSSNEYYTSIDDILYNKTKTKLLCYPAGKDHTSFIIPPHVTSIGDRAFYGCSSLTKIEIPNSVTSIGYNAFDACTLLVTVHYSGTKDQKQKLNIGAGNEFLLNASWEYVSSGNKN